MASTKRTKKTAATSEFLARCKKLFNAPTYRKVLEMVNTEGQGEPAAREWLQENIVRELDF